MIPSLGQGLLGRLSLRTIKSQSKKKKKNYQVMYTVQVNFYFFDNNDL